MSRKKKNYKRLGNYTKVSMGRTAFKPTSQVGRQASKYVRDKLHDELSRIVSTQASPEKVQGFIESLISRVSRGKSATAARILKDLAKPLAVKISGEVMRVALSPVSGVTSPSDSSIPVSMEGGYRQISGANHLYLAKEHKMKFTSGVPEGRWIRNSKLDNGTVQFKVIDTTESYDLTSALRANLTSVQGIGRKQQRLIDTYLFGFRASDLRQYFDMTTYDTNERKTDIAYGAIWKLNSKLTVTNLNKYIPTKVRVNLLRYKIEGQIPETNFLDSVNTDINVQLDGGIPKYYQLQNRISSSLLGPEAIVDSKTPGIKAAEMFKAAFEIVSSKSVKLSAGDRLKINYDHMCGRGVRLDKLHGMDRDASINANFPVTYMLMVESWGEEVDAYSVLNPDRVVKASAPVALQYESSKTVYGIRPSTVAANIQSGTYGYSSDHFAIKLYSKSPLEASGINRSYNDTYANLGVTYNVPVMSSAVEEDAGRIS